MNAKALLSPIAALLVVVIAGDGGRVGAQGFAGLGTTAEGFAMPEPGVALRFPEDHGPHSDYRIEWWYLTANLKAADGTDYGVQWTLFRSALAPGDTKGWDSQQIWMGHAAVTTAAKHYVAERLARGGIGQAGVTAEPLSAWIDDWQMQGRVTPEMAVAGSDALSALDLRASGTDFRYDLKLDARGPLVPQGEGGYSVKSAQGQASYYYSQPFYAVAGTLTLPEGEVAVTGQAWLDREWSSQPLAADQTGWDWFSLHLDTGEKLMAFRMRDSGEGYRSGTWISPEGKPSPLPPGELKVTPLETARVEGRNLPVRWRVEVPGRNFSVTTEVLNTEAWMKVQFPYWEGPIRFTGSHDGRGYLEMTGYK
ncbi:MAG: lipocalin-like domain-containing protein [Allorhizobium sp.]